MNTPSLLDESESRISPPTRGEAVVDLDAEDNNGTGFHSDAGLSVSDLNQVAATVEGLVERLTEERYGSVASTPSLDVEFTDCTNPSTPPDAPTTATDLSPGSSQSQGSIPLTTLNLRTSSRRKSPLNNSAVLHRQSYACPRCPRTFKDQNKARYVAPYSISREPYLLFP